MNVHNLLSMLPSMGFHYTFELHRQICPIFQAVPALITNPAGQSVQQSADFLWRHLQYDLATISRALNRSPDDCLVLLHHLITRLRQQHGKIN